MWLFDVGMNIISYMMIFVLSRRVELALYIFLSGIFQ